jgi:hypothetical protein
MVDDKNLRGPRDRAKVSGSEPYEVGYFAKKHGITTERAREIIHEAGNSREKADQLASRH